MQKQLTGTYWVLTALGFIVLSAVLTITADSSREVILFSALFSTLSVGLIILCFRGFKQERREWAVFAIAFGLVVTGVGFLGTALDLVNEMASLGGLVLFNGGLRGIYK